MKIHVDIMDDSGEILFTHDADASTPSVWNVPSGQRLVSKMPQNSDNENNGSYELFRITIQPHVRVDRPNGWKEPITAPPSAPSLPPGFPTTLPSRPSYGQQAPWGPISPTKSKSGNLSGVPSSLGASPTRGY